MNITLVQTSLYWQQTSKNLTMFEQKLKSVTATDLVLLPEMFTTGFSMEPSSYAMEPKEVSEWLLHQAAAVNAAICATAMVKENTTYYNRLFFATPTGEVHTYNKKHLFTLAGEEKVYASGDASILIEYLGWRIKPLVCYDLRFPVWSRNTEDYDLLLYVANWPERREMAWMSLLKARAIENMSYVAGLNRVGEDGNGVAHSGQSAVYDCLGEVQLRCTPHKEEVKSITLNKKHVQESRKRFGFLNDRDQFALLS